MCSASALPRRSLVGLRCSQPPRQGDGCERAIVPPILGPHHSTFALVFLSAGVCRRLPWDSSPPLFSGPSGRGRMLSRVEETNEPTLRSQLGPAELEHGHPEHTGGSLATGVPERGFGAEHLVRDMSQGMQLSSLCSTLCSSIKHDRGCPEDLCPGISARPCTGRHLWCLCAILSGTVPGGSSARHQKSCGMAGAAQACCCLALPWLSLNPRISYAHDPPQLFLLLSP